MLEFTKVFTKGQSMKKYRNHIETIMKCKNIDFGHVNWVDCSRQLYNEVECMIHIIDNIIDVNTHDYNHTQSYTFFAKILHYSCNTDIIHYMFNNGCINNESFRRYYEFLSSFNNLYRQAFCQCCPHKHFDKLTRYLTKVSLNKFKGYYNIEKYYDMMTTMLLILKAQQKMIHIRSTLPNLPITIIKHLIIPFIYQ